jgi:hypothetical protein
MLQDLKTLSNLVKVAKKLKEAPSSPSELEKELNIPHKSLYRIINCLEAIGVIRKRDDGKYEWIEDWQIFLDGEGYRIKLKHSEELLKPFVEGSELFPPKEQDLNNEFIIQHLRSGYPDIYKEYEEWRKSEERCEKAKERFEGTIREHVAKHGFEIVEFGKLEAGKRQLSHLIYDVAETYFRIGDWQNMKIAWKDGLVWDEHRGEALAREEGLIKEIEKLLRGLMHSESVKEAFKKMEEAMKLRDKAHFNYRKDMEWIALKTKHGEPLRGYCNLCPRIVVKS